MKLTLFEISKNEFVFLQLRLGFYYSSLIDIFYSNDEKRFYNEFAYWGFIRILNRRLKKWLQRKLKN